MTGSCAFRNGTWYFTSVLCAVLTISSCVANSEDENEQDPVLAEVYGQRLKLSDIKPLLVEPVSPEDSISQVRNHVESWVREALLLHEAERNAPVDVNINKLVQDYRASLLISTYENTLVKTLLDTVITQAELKSYYEKNRNQYQLETPIVRCHYLKLKKPVQEAEVFQRLWRSKRPDDKTALVMYAQHQASDYLLQDSTWYRQSEIERLMPPGTMTGQNLYPGRALRLTDDEYEYHLRILQRILGREIAPLSYVNEQARRYILHKRKIDLLQKIKSDIYAREINSVNVKIYI
jgi:hypothetical protein